LQDNCNIVIFPEDSSEGYFDNLKSFYAGFAVLAKACYKKGIDVPMYVLYYHKKCKTYVVDKPVMFSKFIEEGFDKHKIAEVLCNRAN
jgi:hypothetical protein